MSGKFKSTCATHGVTCHAGFICALCGNCCDGKYFPTVGCTSCVGWLRAMWEQRNVLLAQVIELEDAEKRLRAYAANKCSACHQHMTESALCGVCGEKLRLDNKLARREAAFARMECRRLGTRLVAQEAVQSNNVRMLNEQRNAIDWQTRRNGALHSALSVATDTLNWITDGDADMNETLNVVHDKLRSIGAILMTEEDQP